MDLAALPPCRPGHLRQLARHNLDQDPIRLLRELDVGGRQNPWSVCFDATGTRLGCAKGFLLDLEAPLVERARAAAAVWSAAIAWR